MKKLILLFLLIFCGVQYSQINYSPLKIESHILNNKDNSDCLIVFKIPYKNLVFIKEGESYSGGVTISFEAKLVGGNSQVIIRDTKEFSVETDVYQDTKSTSKYLEGLSKLRLDSGKYSILPSIVLLNTKKTHKLKPFNIDVKKKNSINSPIVVDSKPNKELNGYKLVNHNGAIPHSINSYDMILLSDKKFENGLKAEFYQNNKLVSESEVVYEKRGVFNLANIKNGIYLQDNSIGYDYNLYLVKEINTKLFEGKSEVKILDKVTGEEISDYKFNVEWINKPVFLRMGDAAAKILEIITDEDKIDFILDEKEEMNLRLTDFWKNFDPKKETAFNELMAEFYNRADYALLNFSSVNKRNGAFSDRGKIYIKFGAPDKIDRVYTEKNQTNEVWLYPKLNKEFIFQDLDGLGNYTLLN